MAMDSAGSSKGIKRPFRSDGNFLADLAPLTELERLIECPICHYIPLPPIYNCPTGHIICSRCKDTYKRCRCPFCNSSYTLSRNFPLQSIVETLTSYCCNRKSGCKVIGNSMLLKEHVEKCTFCPAKCYLAGVNDCRGKLLFLSDYLAHLTDVHKLMKLSPLQFKQNVFKRSYHFPKYNNVTWDNSAYQSWTNAWFSFDEKIFVNRVFIRGFEIYFQLAVIAETTDEAKYTVKVTIENNKSLKYELTSPVPSIREFCRNGRSVGDGESWPVNKKLLETLGQRDGDALSWDVHYELEKITTLADLEVTGIGNIDHTLNCNGSPLTTKPVSVSMGNADSSGGSKRPWFEIEHKGNFLVGLPALDVFEKLIECPVCQDIPLPPIYNCKTGHFICSKCKAKLKKCPLCKMRYYGSRCFPLESIVKTSTFYCSNRDKGCDMVASIKLLKIHHEECIFSPLKCFLDGLDGCKGELIFLSDYVSHLYIVHYLQMKSSIEGKSNVFSHFYRFSDWNNINYGRETYFSLDNVWFTFDKQIFVTRSFQRGSQFFFQLGVIAERNDDSAKYSVKVTIENDKFLKYELTSPVPSIREFRDNGKSGSMCVGLNIGGVKKTFLEAIGQRVPMKEKPKFELTWNVRYELTKQR